MASFLSLKVTFLFAPSSVESEKLSHRTSGAAGFSRALWCVLSHPGKI